MQSKQNALVVVVGVGYFGFGGYHALVGLPIRRVQTHDRAEKQRKITDHSEPHGCRKHTDCENQLTFLSGRALQYIR
jgi:hypothetical protein